MAQRIDGGSQDIADFTDLADVAAYLAEGYNATANDDATVFVINDTAGLAYAYLVDEQAGVASTIQAADLSLVASCYH